MARGYALATAIFFAALTITVTTPLLRERLTFFAFWPAIFAASWFGGLGPGLLSTAASAAAIALLMGSPQETLVGPANLLVPLMALCVTGAGGALLAHQRQQAEAALREEQSRFRSVADSAPVLIWISDAAERLTYVNRPWLAFTGRELTQELGSGWRSALHPDDVAPRLAAFVNAVRRREPYEVEYRLRRHDGEYRRMIERAVPRMTAGGDLLEYVGSCNDITDQSAARARSEAALAQAEVASRAKDAFLATISHELRTPLSPILAWVQMLRDGALTPAQRDRALQVIERSARTQAQLVEDLLDVSRIVEGRLRLQVRPVVLDDVIQRTLDVARPAADAKAIRFQIVLDSQGATVAGDPDRLQQIVWNLVSNAVKFTPKGGRVQVTLARVDSHVEIAVADTGMGITSAQHLRLFERFWQADASPSRPHAGLGLGLAIVRQLVELHGGSVAATSPGIDQGSTFTVMLPLAPVAPLADEVVRRHPTLRQESAAAALAPLTAIRILLVDDDPDSNEAMRVLLVSRGAEVRIAASAEQALAVLESWLPDLMVSDIGMPGRDGYALLADIRNLVGPAAQMPVIALTAYASVDDRVRLVSAGFHTHLAKPVEPGELTAVVAAALRTQPRLVPDSAHLTAGPR